MIVGTNADVASDAHPRSVIRIRDIRSMGSESRVIHFPSVWKRMRPRPSNISTNDLLARLPCRATSIDSIIFFKYLWRGYKNPCFIAAREPSSKCTGRFSPPRGGVPLSLFSFYEILPFSRDAGGISVCIPFVQDVE